MRSKARCWVGVGVVILSKVAWSRVMVWGSGALDLLDGDQAARSAARSVPRAMASLLGGTVAGTVALSKPGCRLDPVPVV